MTNARKATILIDGKDPVEFPIITPVHGNDCIDIRTLAAKTGMFTYDSGYLSTASCQSSVTFIDGEVKTYRITAGVSVGGYLAREAGESGILSLWDAQESTAIPIAHIREWKIKPVQPVQEEAV